MEAQQLAPLLFSVFTEDAGQLLDDPLLSTSDDRKDSRSVSWLGCTDPPAIWPSHDVIVLYRVSIILPKNECRRFTVCCRHR